MKEPLNEEAFIQQYVLTRAGINRNTTFNGVGAADSGKTIYEHIQGITKTKDKQQE